MYNGMWERETRLELEDKRDRNVAINVRRGQVGLLVFVSGRRIGVSSEYPHTLKLVNTKARNDSKRV